MLLSDLAQGGELRATGIREHNIELALLPLDLREEAVKIVEVRHVSLYAGDISSDLLYRPSQLRITAPRDEDVRAPSFTNCFAVARPMPLLPPVMSAIFLSSLFMYSSPLIKACQIVRTTLPKGRPSTR